MNSKRIQIVAEAGVNHNGDIEKAFQLVDVAVDAQVDAIKFQTFRSDHLVSKNTPKAPYQEKSGDPSESQEQMLARLELGRNVFRDLKNYAESKGILFMSTAFDFDSLSFLVDDLQLDVLKIPSGEITNGPLLWRFAKSKKNLILSTGMSTLQEIEAALSVIAFGLLGGNSPTRKGIDEAYNSIEGQNLLKKYVVLLHCTTEYPAPFESINLRAMETLREKFKLDVGYSDHSLGVLVPCAATVLGATLLEKHFTLDKNLSGPDHHASLEPDQLKDMVRKVRSVEVILGTSTKHPQYAELSNKKVVRKGLVALTEIKVGDVFTELNVGIKRPESGRSPMDYWEILGTRSSHSYKPDERIK